MTDNVSPLLKTLTVRFRPLERETLRLVAEIERTPEDAYSRLMSAAVVAGAVLGLPPETIAEHARTFAGPACEAIKGRPDIFGYVADNTDRRPPR